MVTMKSLYCKQCGKWVGEMAPGSKVVRGGFDVICRECSRGRLAENWDVPDFMKVMFDRKGEGE